MEIKSSTKYIFAAVVMLLLAFLQCYRTVHDLHWAYEPDFDRDIGYIRSALDGHYGTDPNYLGQYMWYNPLLYMSETLVVKMTGLPINIVVARSGMFLNLIGPVFFFIMLIKLFDYKIALAGLLSFLFLALGNMPCWGGATYSPWQLADCYVQFIFYINILLCYKAFSTQKIGWFISLGAFLGISFLGHAAPTIIIIFILILIQGQRVIRALRAKNFPQTGKYVVQGFFTFVPFLIFSFPFLYFILVKYHMHFVNRTILECAPGIFSRKDTLQLIKTNITFSLFIAIIGLWWFYKKYPDTIIKKIILNWFYITAVMYCYESVLPTANKLLHITLPDTIPAMHYFFYLKGVQSVFFAFGFVFLISPVIKWIQGFVKGKFWASATNISVLLVLLYALAYYPVYTQRSDFSLLRQQALDKEKETDKIEVYNFISKNLPLDEVMLCKHDQSLFPVMATGIKMVSVEVYFSNPYISYVKREKDRDDMLTYLTTGAPTSTEKLFKEYQVSYILLPNADYAKYKNPPFFTGKVIFRNAGFTILSVK